MPDRLAVVTLHTGTAYADLAAVTTPTHADYARRCGADFIVLDRDLGGHPHYNKWQIEPLFDTYSRILYLDADTIIRPDTPDLFALVPPERFAGEDELLTWPDHARGLREFVDRMGLDPLPSVPFYVNGGVTLASRCHRNVFRPPERVLADLPWPEQHHLNARLIGERVPMMLLPEQWNDRHGRPGWQRTTFVRHYSVRPLPERVRVAAADLAGWTRPQPSSPCPPAPNVATTSTG